MLMFNKAEAWSDFDKIVEIPDGGNGNAWVKIPYATPLQ